MPPLEDPDGNALFEDAEPDVACFADDQCSAVATMIAAGQSTIYLVTLGSTDGGQSWSVGSLTVDPDPRVRHRQRVLGHELSPGRR